MDWLVIRCCAGIWRGQATPTPRPAGGACSPGPPGALTHPGVGGGAGRLACRGPCCSSVAAIWAHTSCVVSLRVCTCYGKPAACFREPRCSPATSLKASEGLCSTLDEWTGLHADLSAGHLGACMYIAAHSPRICDAVCIACSGQAAACQARASTRLHCSAGRYTCAGGVWVAKRAVRPPGGSTAGAQASLAHARPGMLPGQAPMPAKHVPTKQTQVQASTGGRKNAA